MMANNPRVCLGTAFVDPFRQTRRDSCLLDSDQKHALRCALMTVGEGMQSKPFLNLTYQLVDKDLSKVLAGCSDVQLSGQQWLLLTRTGLQHRALI